MEPELTILIFLTISIAVTVSECVAPGDRIVCIVNCGEMRQEKKRWSPVLLARVCCRRERSGFELTLPQEVPSYIKRRSLLYYSPDRHFQSLLQVNNTQFLNIFALDETVNRPYRATVRKQQDGDKRSVRSVFILTTRNKTGIHGVTFLRTSTAKPQNVTKQRNEDIKHEKSTIRIPAVFEVKRKIKVRPETVKKQNNEHQKSAKSTRVSIPGIFEVKRRITIKPKSVTKQMDQARKSTISIPEIEETTLIRKITGIVSKQQNVKYSRSLAAMKEMIKHLTTVLPETIHLERKSVKYCKIYKELTVEYLHATLPLPKMISFTIPMDNCPTLIMPLVVGGLYVNIGEFPHMAALAYNKMEYIDYLCGGSLISDKYILTAAHCIETKWGHPIHVMLGSLKLYSRDARKMDIKRLIVHPDFKARHYSNDIALIELKQQVSFSKLVRPACISRPSTDAHNPGKVVTATGWGKTGHDKPGTITLKKVQLQILNNTVCLKHYKNHPGFYFLNEGIGNTLFCANGKLSVYHDTCQGDSGGPVQSLLPGEQCLYEVFGITSFGRVCGSSIPAVYTKVERFLQWIEDIVWP